MSDYPSQAAAGINALILEIRARDTNLAAVAELTTVRGTLNLVQNQRDAALAELAEARKVLEEIMQTCQVSGLTIGARSHIRDLLTKTKGTP
jgi:hypothetical protein